MDGLNDLLNAMLRFYIIIINLLNVRDGYGFILLHQTCMILIMELLIIHVVIWFVCIGMRKDNGILLLIILIKKELLSI